MNAPPEANSEYSRGSGASGRLLLPRWQSSSTPASPGSETASSAVLAMAGGAPAAHAFPSAYNMVAALRAGWPSPAKGQGMSSP